MKWARGNNVSFIGEKSGKRYKWSEEDLIKFQEYLKTVKLGRKLSKALDETTNLDTLYHRLYRSKKNGNIELYNQTRKILDDLKAKK